MARFFNNARYIISFCVLCVIIQLSLGQKFLEKFLMLVLFSMVILNATPVVDLIKNTLGSDADNSDSVNNSSNAQSQKNAEAVEKGVYNPILGSDYYNNYVEDSKDGEGGYWSKDDNGNKIYVDSDGLWHAENGNVMN